MSNLQVILQFISSNEFVKTSFILGKLDNIRLRLIDYKPFNRKIFNINEIELFSN